MTKYSSKMATNNTFTPSSLRQSLWPSILLFLPSAAGLGLHHESISKKLYSPRLPEIRSPPSFVAMFAAAIVAASPPCLALGSDLLARGVVTLPPDVIGPAKDSSAALYITARPDRADNVPVAILSGTRGKPPPILAARFASPLAFPFEFELTDENLTPEGAPSEGSSSGERWWARDDLVVSARLDSDGVAATRDPEDLVGRALMKKTKLSKAVPATAASPGDQASTEVPQVTVPLQGRGFGGKLVTGKSAAANTPGP